MDWSSILWQGATIAVTMGITTLLISLLNKGANKTEALVIANRSTIRLNPAYFWLGWLMVLIAVPYAILPFFEENDLFFYVLSLIMILGSGGGGYYILTYYYLHRVSWDSAAFSITSRSGKANTIEWDQVTDVSFNPGSGFMLIHSSAGKHKVSMHMIGLRAFTKALADRSKINFMLPL